MERLLHKVLNPHVFRLPNLLTGHEEDVEIRDARALIDLLYQDVDGSRAALVMLLDQVVIHPCEPGMELELIGTLGGVLRRWFPDEILFLLDAEKEAVPVQVTPSGTVDNGGSRGLQRPQFFTFRSAAAQRGRRCDGKGLKNYGG